MTTTLVLFISLAALQLADLLLTRTAIMTRKGKEANPIVAKLMDRFGLMNGLLLAKGVGVVAAGLLFVNDAKFLLTAFIAVYTLVVINNYKVVRHG